MQMSISGKQPDAARLLVVDDEIRLLRSLQELLVLHGYQTELAQGGRQAIERLDNDHFDAILLDLRMEDISGHDVLQHIADQQYETPVIVISGESSFGAITQALLLGATDYIRKPYSSDELLKTLSNTLTNQRLKTENRLFQQRLWQSEKLHRHLVEHSPDVIYVLDHEGRFTFINNRVSDLLGYQTEALLGQHFSVVLDDEEEWQQLSCDTGHGDVESSFRKQAEIRVRNKFHQVRHLYVEYFPLDFSQTGVIDQSISEITSTTQGTFGIARDITERKQAEQTIQFQAYHDLLTGLPNRTLFKDRLEMAVAHAKRNKDIFAVLFIDLDRFKVVNDSLGHATGDLLLQAVSETLRSSLREGDTLARFGGDEFTLLLPSLHSEQDAATIAGKIMARWPRNLHRCQHWHRALSPRRHLDEPTGRPCRSGDVSGEKAQPQWLLLLRIEHGCSRFGAAAARKRHSSRHRGPAVLRAVPATDGHRFRKNPRHGGIGALASPTARTAAAERIHPHRRRERIGADARRMGIEAGLRRLA